MTTFTTQDRIHAEKDGSFTIDCRPKPLTDEQISFYWDKIRENAILKSSMQDIQRFARAIEKAHGIR